MFLLWKRRDYIEGIIDMTSSKGKAYLQVSEKEEDIFIARRNTKQITGW